MDRRTVGPTDSIVRQKITAHWYGRTATGNLTERQKDKTLSRNVAIPR